MITPPCNCDADFMEQHKPTCARYGIGPPGGRRLRPNRRKWRPRLIAFGIVAVVTICAANQLLELLKNLGEWQR